MKWYNSTDEAINVEINDFIGFWGIEHQQVNETLQNAGGKDINLNIASLGGDISHALPIYNMLKSYSGRVTANIYGDAASAATFISLAADEVNMVDNAMYLIHNVWTMVAGDSNELRTAADEMDKFNDNIKDIYRKETGNRKSQITKWMDNGDWWTAKEAKTNGFISKVSEPSEILNREYGALMNHVNKDVYKGLMNKLNQNKDEMNISELKAELTELKDTVANFISNKKEEAPEVKIMDEAEVTEKLDAINAAIEGAEAKDKAIEDLNAKIKELEAEVAKNTVVETPTSEPTSEPKVDVEPTEVNAWDATADAIQSKLTGLLK